MKNKLTQSFVQNLKPKDEVVKVWDTLLTGFMVIVNPGGKKTYFLDYRRANGKRTHHKIGDAQIYTVTEAREIAQTFLADVASGKNPLEKTEVFTFGQFIEEIYGPWLLENKKSGNGTLEMIRFNFKFLFDGQMDGITISQIEQWRAKRKKKDGVKASSLNRVIGALLASLNWAVKRNIIENNPLSRLEKLPERDSVTKVRYLLDDERDRLMKALDDREKEVKTARESHNRWCRERNLTPLPSYRSGQYVDHFMPIVLLSLHTGIRRNAVLSLEWRDVNFNDRMIMVRAATSKTDKQYYVPMNENVFQLLSTWRDQSQNTSPGKLVFPSPKTGQKMDNCNSAWEHLLRDAVISDFRWHDMRHDFASQLVMKGIDLNTVRELLGHADLKMTLRYAHLAPAAKMKAVEVLESVRKSA